MKIICPQCDFLKDVSVENFPSANFMATCPKCGHRFRISIEDHELVQDENLSNTTDSERNALSDEYSANTQQYDDNVKSSKVANTDNYGDNNVNNNNNNNSKNDENYHKSAYNAYENESRRLVDQEINDNFSVDNPWENAKSEGYFSSFYQTVVRIMFFAPRFFAGLQKNMSLLKSLTFYILIIVLQVLISHFWANTLFQYIANTSSPNDEIHTLLSYIASSNLPMTLLINTAFSVMQLYVTSFVYYLSFSMVVKEKVDFSLVFQVVAYSIAPLLLSIVPLIGSLVGMIWAIACSFIGCRYALRLTIMQTALALAPIYMLMLPLLYLMVIAPK